MPQVRNLQNKASGVVLVLGATVISALSSFLVLLLVAPALGPSQYAVFSVYWSALFMIVGVLFGIQQESTRAVAGLSERITRPATSVFVFSLVLGAVLLVVLSLSGSTWAGFLFQPGNESWVLPLSIAVASYAPVAALNGVLGGRQEWAAFSLLPVVDATLRLVLVLVGIWLGWSGLLLAWAVAIPFPVSLGVTWLASRSRIRGFGRVPGTYITLSANVGRTMIASASTAVLVNGFPVVLSIFGHADPAELGAIILALMLTRAPIMVPLTALQSMLIARFAAQPREMIRTLLVIIGALLLLSLLVALAAFAWGEFLLGVLFGDGYALSGSLLAGLVLASGCLGVLTASGSAILAAKRHNFFALGWILASAIAVLVVAVMPAELGLRVVIALGVGPLIGAVVHIVGLRCLSSLQEEIVVERE